MKREWKDKNWKTSSALDFSQEPMNFLSSGAGALPPALVSRYLQPFWDEADGQKETLCKIKKSQIP